MLSNEYIIVSSSGDASGVSMQRFQGTENELKEKLVEMIIEDHTDAEDYDYGSERVSELSVEGNMLIGYAVHTTYSTYYSAMRLSDIPLMSQ